MPARQRQQGFCPGDCVTAQLLPRSYQDQAQSDRKAAGSMKAQPKGMAARPVTAPKGIGAVDLQAGRQEANAPAACLASKN